MIVWLYKVKSKVYTSCLIEYFCKSYSEECKYFVQYVEETWGEI